MQTDHLSVFTKIYENNIWGNNNDPNYKGTSGGGSDVGYNINTYIPFIRRFFEEKKIKTVVDLGCGDFRCGKYIYDDLDIMYNGYDAYDKVVENNKRIYNPSKYNFTHLDFYNKKEDLISADVCILKDVIQHWALNDIYLFMDYLVESKKFKYILICNCCNQTVNNTNTTTGGFRPLSCNYLPLNKYNPSKLYNYDTKEVSVIEVENNYNII